MKVSHFLFSAIAVILSLSMIFSCNKPEGSLKPDPTPTPTPKEAVVIDQGVDTKPTIKQEGGEAKVSFTATENWTASIINTKADSWISLDKTSGSAGSVTITITVQGNDTPNDRSATVQIKAGNTTIDIVVSQKGKDSLTTTASKNEFGSEGGELTIEVKANIDFTYSIAEGCKDWISESGTKAMTTTTLTFKIAENEDVKKREGSVTIKSSLGEEVIKVYQSGTEPTIVITQNEYSVEAKGETIQVEVSSNVNVEMAMPDDCDWIKEEETKAISTNTFYLNVLENTSLDSRTAKVVFKNAENGLAEEVTVKQAGREVIQVESISFDKTELSLTEGDNTTLVATVLPENADNKNVIWNSSNAEIATVEDGVVTAIKEGEATITAKTEDGGKTATCAVTVKEKVYPVESISLDKTTAEITEGETITLTATIKPENATNKNVIWSSSDDNVATVNDGVITAIKAGETTITAKTEDGGKTATCSIKVKAKVYPVESISLDKANAEITEGETITLTATIKPDNATNKKVIWSSSNEETATVNDGVVTAIKAGEATITAKTEDGGKTATCAIKIKAKVVAVESVSLDKTTAEITEGETITLTATIKPDNATNKKVIWSSSNEEIAEVEDGVVTAIKAGEVTITAKTEDGGKTATCAIKIKAKVVAVESVSLDKTTAEITEGETITLSATVKPDNATNKKVIWSSSNEEIAEVEDGVVTAIKAGEVTITAKTEDGGKTATCSIKVKAKVYPVESVELNKTSASLKVGETATLTATVKPNNASDKTVTWSSSDASVASVENGVVTAKKIGTATITAKAGEKTATCSITVEATPVTSVELDKTSASLKVGKTITLTATVKPNNATNKKVIWSSSNEEIATVENGVVTAIKEGEVIITAKTEDGGKTATCTISAYQPQTEETTEEELF